MVCAMEVVTDEYMRVPIVVRMTVETLAVVRMNFDDDFYCDYIETVNYLHDMGVRSYTPKKELGL